MHILPFYRYIYTVGGDGRHLLVAAKTQGDGEVAQNSLDDGHRRQRTKGATRIAPSPWAAQIQGDVAPKPRFWATEVACYPVFFSVDDEVPMEKKV
ncbi:UNVERIFIED_CONTAM: hypothetical protein Slati_0990200 [Sesamum latifolium]|uniref:Uncharacterized protein n=1 Tax=Sesamum latifolium TaxID=2727402 RepID=A0AAW2XXL9_9LAMI